MLISAGTAICGGSAIAAVGSVIGAAEASMAVAMSTVFVLNALALYVFPAVGHLLGLTQQQFGIWAGVAIHDVSSVVGAASTYGAAALETATAIKLSRALWIIPVALFFAAVRPKRDSRDSRSLPIPWFIGCFVLASLARSFVPGIQRLSPGLVQLSRLGMTLTLFMIGSGLSRNLLRRVGARPLLQGIVLWLFLAVSSLLIVYGTL